MHLLHHVFLAQPNLDEMHSKLHHAVEAAPKTMSPAFHQLLRHKLIETSTTFLAFKDFSHVSASDILTRGDSTCRRQAQEVSATHLQGVLRAENVKQDLCFAISIARYIVDKLELVSGLQSWSLRHRVFFSSLSLSDL